VRLSIHNSSCRIAATVAMIDAQRHLCYRVPLILAVTTINASKPSLPWPLLAIVHPMPSIDPLLSNMASFRPLQPAPMDQEQSSQPKIRPLLTQKPKRTVTLGACIACRKRKSKVSCTCMFFYGSMFIPASAMVTALFVLAVFRKTQNVSMSWAQTRNHRRP